MKQFAEDWADGDNKIIFYIDIFSDEDQVSKISSVFPHIDEQRGLTVVHFSGGFGEWVKTVLDIHLTKQSR